MTNMQAPGSSVNVSVQAVIDQLHKRYGRQTAALMQEVSELQCAGDAQADELAELRSKFTAMSGPAPLMQFDDLRPRPPAIDLGARRPVADNPQA
jgi:hypothetical protein